MAKKRILESRIFKIYENLIFTENCLIFRCCVGAEDPHPNPRDLMVAVANCQDLPHRIFLRKNREVFKVVNKSLLTTTRCSEEEEGGRAIEQ